jgi:glycerophosphoryl diester phosphodiesterase
MCSVLLKRRKFDAINRVEHGHHIYIEGHRGMNKLQPQNTILSFKEAIQHELDSVELDIWLTKDHVPVVIHGGDFGELEEFTTGKGNIKETTLTDLALIKTKEGDQPIPTLDEVIRELVDEPTLNVYGVIAVIKVKKSRSVLATLKPIANR